jgi:hypothetical protein
MLGLDLSASISGGRPGAPQHVGHLALLGIPGRWGRIDAFGRGRVDVERRWR